MWACPAQRLLPRREWRGNPAPALLTELHSLVPGCISLKEGALLSFPRGASWAKDSPASLPYGS